MPVRRKLSHTKSISKSMADLLGVATLTSRTKPVHVEISDGPVQERQRVSRDLVGIASTHVTQSTPEQYAVNVEEQDRAFTRHSAPFYLSHYRCAWSAAASTDIACY